MQAFFSFFLIFLRIFFSTIFGLSFAASAVVEGAADLVKVFDDLVEPFPETAVAETLSLDIPSDFF